jgi:biofilm PGA synthesis lipoprotein PgaB
MIATALALLLTAAAPGRLEVLCYHHVDDGKSGLKADRYTVSLRRLTEQIDWLRGEGWQPVSLQQIFDSREGKRPLPEKAVLLTFDDGYADVYSTVFPLLKRSGSPALIALVGSWMEAAEGGQVDVDGQPVPKSAFVSWDQVREMQASGLVEVASHTWDLHRSLRANAQGGTQPAAVIHPWRGPGLHESADELEARISADLQRSAAILERKTGRRPRAVVWPYGRYTGETQEAARAAGLPVMFTLRDGGNGPDTPLDELRRYLVMEETSLGGFAGEMRGNQGHDPVRAVRVDLDPGTQYRPIPR